MPSQPAAATKPFSQSQAQLSKLVNGRPAVVVTDQVNAELRSTSGVVVMVDKHVGVIVGEDSRMARSVDGAVTSEDLRATAFHHELASLINVRARDFAGAADQSAVSALNSLPAFVESDPEVESISVLSDVGRLDGTTVVGSRGDRDEVVVVVIDRLAG